MSDHMPERVLASSFSGTLNWREAIQLACRPLREAGLVPEAFAESILSSVDKYGPHFILTPGIALPCSQDEFIPASAAALSVLAVDPPVSFDPDDPACAADLFVVAAAKDAETAQQLTDLLIRRLRDSEAALQMKEAVRKEDADSIASLIQSGLFL